MTDRQPTTSPTATTARSTAGVGIAAVVAAGAGYLVLVIAARSLSTAENAEFLTFWSLLFFLFGTLGGLQSEVTRAVHLTVHGGTTTRGSRVLPLGLGVGLALAVAVAATSPLWARGVLGAAPVTLVAVVALGALAFAGHASVAGILAGQGRWPVYSGLVGTEAVVRLLLVTVAAFAGAGVVGLAMATTGAAATWVLATAVPLVRRALPQRTGAATPRLVRSTGHAVVGAASSAALVVGFTVLLRATTEADVFDAAAPLIMAVQLTRAPLLVPLGAYQGVAITYVLRNRERGGGPLLRVAGAIAGVGVLAAGAAAALGPWLMAVILGEEYRVAPLLLAELTVAATLLALLTLTGAAALAVGRHRAFAVGWLVATAATVAVLLLPATIETRVVVGLAVGPLAGMFVHVLAVRRGLGARR